MSNSLKLSKNIEVKTRDLLLPEERKVLTPESLEKAEKFAIIRMPAVINEEVIIFPIESSHLPLLEFLDYILTGYEDVMCSLLDGMDMLDQEAESLPPVFLDELKAILLEGVCLTTYQEFCGGLSDETLELDGLTSLTEDELEGLEENPKWWGHS